MSVSQFWPLILADVLIGLAWFVGPPFRQIMSYCSWSSMDHMPAYHSAQIHKVCIRGSVSSDSQLWSSLQNDFFANIYLRHFINKTNPVHLLQDCSEHSAW